MKPVETWTPGRDYLRTAVDDWNVIYSWRGLTRSKCICDQSVLLWYDWWAADSCCEENLLKRPLLKSGSLQSSAVDLHDFAAMSQLTSGNLQLNFKLSSLLYWALINKWVQVQTATRW